MSDVVRLSVTEEHDGKRLDKYLAEQMDPGGRRRARFLCERGLVLANGRRAKKNLLLTTGTEVVVSLETLGHAKPAPEIGLSLLLETEHLVIVDKPPGISSGAILGSEEGTLAGALLARYPEMGEVGFNRMEPGLVHRLDKQTSGVLVAARSQLAFNQLRAAITEERVEKRYLCVTEAGALLDDGKRTTGLAPSDGDSRRVVEVASQRQFSTEYRVMQRGRKFDLVEAIAHRAYRHQIRCHFAALGAALVGDELYGSFHLKQASLGTRHALHASHIEGAADGVGRFAASSALPVAFRTLLEDDA